MIFARTLQTQSYNRSNVLCCIYVQTLRVGGLFSQFQLDNNVGYVVDNAGIGAMAAVQMAITQVNNKSDGVYDHLLRNTTVNYYFRAARLTTL